MAYSITNPPECRNQGIGNQGVAEWYYSSTDSAATVDTNGYFSNGYELGMKVNDVVSVTNSSTGLTTKHVVLAVTEATGANLGLGIAITSLTNTD